MPIAITSQLSRGSLNTSPFPLAAEGDLKLSHTTKTYLVDRDAIPEWQRMAKMTCYVIETDKTYRLGFDLTIPGQAWTEVTFNVPDDVLVHDDILGVDGFIKPELIQNVFLNNSYVVASEVAMLALHTLTGNFVIRTDTSAIYVKLNNDDPADIGDFAAITYPGAVLSVNGLTGNVTINLAGLIDANPSLFNTYVSGTAVITDLAAAVVALQGVVDGIDLTTKADLVDGKVPLSQLPALGVSSDWGTIGGTISDQTDLWAYLSAMITVRGAFDASANAFPTGPIKAFSLWFIPDQTKAGVLGGSYVNAKDLLLSLVDSPGTDPANWRII